MSNKVLVIHTGGTIAMQENQDGHVQLDLVNPLYATTDTLSSQAKITVRDYANIPSAQVDPAFIHQLAVYITEQIDTHLFDGVVVTHGTDTLEETAYLLDLLLDLEQPVVVTGAMRSSNEISADGEHNLNSSIRVAMDKDAMNKGVLVVFNDEIHAARYVTKAHTSNVAAFKSFNAGPIGSLTKQRIHFNFKVENAISYNIDALTKKVPIVKVYTGIDKGFIQAFGQFSDGIILEAFGQGNVPPAITPALEELISKNIPIILTSRCPIGSVAPTYNYEGGGNKLKELGVIFARELNSQKARLKLLVALEMTNNKDDLIQFFN